MSRDEIAKLHVADLMLVWGELIGVNPLAAELEEGLRTDEGALEITGLPQGVGGKDVLEFMYSVRQASSKADGLTLLP